MGIAKFVGTLVAQKLVQNAVSDWFDDIEVTKAVRLLFHQAVLDERGEVPAERCLIEEAGFRFAVTPLVVSGDVRGPVYFVEAANTRVDGNDTKRTRHFLYNSAGRNFELAAIHGACGASTTEPAHPKWLTRTVPPVRAVAVTEPADWFVHRTPADPRVFLPGVGLYTVFRRDRKQNNRAGKRVRAAFDEGCLGASGVVEATASPVTVGGLSLWVTPLRTTGASERAVFHHVMAVDAKAPEDHPLRVVTLVHNGMTGVLQWLH
ncbi:hypothetical protein ACSNOK_17550 [Streptomyces sp. URMC 126]|uniref:hypothetical protein n=1 Tax=Streptomyces sp. URMC 126 TaxID=3423401 RepID=UPI003F1A495F